VLSHGRFRGMVLSSRFVEDFAGFKDPAGEPEIRFRRGWIPARMVVNQDERISAEGRQKQGSRLHNTHLLAVIIHELASTEICKG
jgi:hypothetical protein